MGERGMLRRGSPDAPGLSLRPQRMRGWAGLYISFFCGSMAAPDGFHALGIFLPVVIRARFSISWILVSVTLAYGFGVRMEKESDRLGRRMGDFLVSYFYLFSFSLLLRAPSPSESVRGDRQDGGRSMLAVSPASKHSSARAQNWRRIRRRRV